jgi:WD40 repeat protein
MQAVEIHQVEEAVRIFFRIEQMELRSEKDTKIERSPSMLYGNLSCNADGTFVYAHKDDVILLRALGEARLSQSETAKGAISSIRGEVVRGRPFVVFTNPQGVHIFDAQRDAVVLHVPGADCRGFAFLDLGDRLVLLVGHTSGEVSVLDLTPELAVVSGGRVAQHAASVTCVGAAQAPYATSTVAATGDCDGELRLWNSQAAAFTVLPCKGDVVTAIVLFTDNVCATYGSGQVRVFGALAGDLRVAISAHSRWITGLAYNPHHHTIATSSEDQLLCVWKMPTPDVAAITLVGQKMHANKLLTGCAFSPDGASVTAAAYDAGHLLTFASA